MAFLMLLHEKMRLQRRQNKLTLKQLRMGNKIDRIKRNIEKKQKYYQKLEQNLENQAKRMTNDASIFFRNMFGLGVQNNFNPYGYMYGGGGNISAAINVAQQWNGKDPYTGQDVTCLGENGKAWLVQYMQGRLGPKYENGAPVSGAYQDADGNAVTEEQYAALKKLGQYCNSQVSMYQAECSDMTTNYSNNVSIWLEAQKEVLNAEQDMVLDALQDEENDYEMEKTSIETELEYIKERKQALESALTEGVKDSAPKFGLG